MKKFLFLIVILLTLIACAQIETILNVSNSPVPSETIIPSIPPTIANTSEPTFTSTLALYYNDPILPPGQWILFSKGNSHNSADTELFAVRPDGSELTQITNNSYSDWQPRISPDGTKLAYCRYPTQERAYLYIMDIATGMDELILDAIFCGDAYHWFADSNRIIYQGGGEAHVIDVTTKEVITIGGTTSGVRHPSVSPDMTEIAYSGVPWALYVQSIDGNGSDLHTLPGSDPRGAAWSPDGSWIAFESYYGSLYITKTDGSLEIPIGSGFSPAWSPDGTQIVYHNLDGGQIFTLNIDSDGNASDQRTVVSLGGWISYLSWGEVVEQE